MTIGEKGGMPVTTVCIINACQSVTSVIVVSRKNFVPRLLKVVPPGTLVLTTLSGWMNSELFLDVMSHSIKHSSSSMETPRISISDKTTNSTNLLKPYYFASSYIRKVTALECWSVRSN